MGNQKYKVESRTEREQEDDVALSKILAPYLHHAPPPTTCTDWACWGPLCLVASKGSDVGWPGPFRFR